MFEEKVIKTDVLVVGGGLAGCFAAVKAKEQGVDVTLVSKGYVGRSGQTPWANTTGVFNPEWGHKMEDWVEQSCTRGEYMNNRDWTETILKDSYARFQDLKSWGVEFLKDQTGNYMKEKKLGSSESLMWALHDGSGGAWVKPLRSYPKKIGVNILERVMIVELIYQNERVAGAIGFSMEGESLYIIEAKTTILCAGAGGFKPWGGWPICDLTADGHVMAYKVGAEISGKEFEDFHVGAKKPGMSAPNFGSITNAEGQVVGRGMGLSSDFEAHSGRAPLKKGDQEVVSNTAHGMSIHTIEGVWPVDKDCFSGIPRLYVAGDNCATWVAGAQYAGMGFATATATATGARAGTAAALFASQEKNLILDGEELARVRKAVLAPMEREGGFSPAWVTQLLQNFLMPYFVLRVKSGERLQAALTFVEFIRDDLVPKIFARDPHELRLAHETKNMVTNAEMRLRASLFRTESRGTHYREDYPHRDDPNWLAWVMIKKEDGHMKLYKKPIPQEWWPDLSKPYNERYPNPFPGE